MGASEAQGQFVKIFTSVSAATRRCARNDRVHSARCPTPVNSPQLRHAGIRERLLRQLRIYFAHHRWPRVAMGVVLALTAAVGFFASFGLLHAGVDKMWVRYPLAAIIGWSVFIGLVRLWAEIEYRCFADARLLEEMRSKRDPGDAEALPEFSSEVAKDWVHFATDSFPDDDEGCLLWLIVVVIGPLLLASAVGIYGIVVGAPALIAELFLDALLVTALYRRLRALDRRWWVTSVIRRTFRPAIWTVVTLTLAGGLMQAVAPDAKSIGGFIDYCREAGEVSL
jgi:hypothetical protein